MATRISAGSEARESTISVALRALRMEAPPDGRDDFCLPYMAVDWGALVSRGRNRINRRLERLKGGQSWLWDVGKVNGKVEDGGQKWQGLAAAVMSRFNLGETSWLVTGGAHLSTTDIKTNSHHRQCNLQLNWTVLSVSLCAQCSMYNS